MKIYTNITSYPAEVLQECEANFDGLKVPEFQEKYSPVPPSPALFSERTVFSFISKRLVDSGQTSRAYLVLTRIVLSNVNDIISILNSLVR